MVNNLRGQMKIDDLEIGQTLIAVDHHGFSRSTHSESQYQIIKKMKTRLVIGRLREVEGAPVLSPITQRVIVRDGKVTSGVEGWGNRRGISLHTEDDAALPEYRAETERTNLVYMARDRAEAAQRNLTVQTATAAISALQAWLDANRDEE